MTLAMCVTLTCLVMNVSTSGPTIMANLLAPQGNQSSGRLRYFGGVKLGTSGLIVAYRTAAAEAIAAAEVVEKTVDESVSILFEYPFMNDVMRIVKEESPAIVSQGYDSDCSMTLRIRKDSMSRLRSRLEKIATLRFVGEE